ncbi:MAG TPA: hypothetical protein IGS52_18845 [Oscillatoriaceae cyanobacterium M33_DOE_052]|uniref:Uncharacterized protein n=1 Tax=Planktothricoides sp. SpSt-374 TaxID=2282167 RepID=A0A7C3VIW3_9CYAN|nr:hypothetical protein [Oscillatoriaceae cyanobacterium M33_DOE_052]
MIESFFVFFVVNANPAACRGVGVACAQRIAFGRFISRQKTQNLSPECFTLTAEREVMLL